MIKKRFTVKQLIKYLADFNPNAVIMNNINPSWVTGMGEEEIRDIDNEKLNALHVWLFDDDEEAKRVIDLLGLNGNNLNEKARERSKALSKLQKENEELKQQINELQFNKALGQQEYQKGDFE